MYFYFRGNYYGIISFIPVKATNKNLFLNPKKVSQESIEGPLK